MLNTSKINTLAIFGGVLHRKEASVRYRLVSETSERRSEVRQIGGDSYGC